MKHVARSTIDEISCSLEVLISVIGIFRKLTCDTKLIIDYGIQCTFVSSFVPAAEYHHFISISKTNSILIYLAILSYAIPSYLSENANVAFLLKISVFNIHGTLQTKIYSTNEKKRIAFTLSFYSKSV